MNFPLSKAPDGLLGTLDLKSLGRNPAALSDVLDTSIDPLEFYLLRNRLCVAGSGPFSAVNVAISLSAVTPPSSRYMPVGGNGNFTVPPDEVLRIKSLCVLTTRAAADAALTLEYTVFIRRPLANVTVGIGSAIFGPHPATDLSFIQPVPLTQPLWLGPGDQLRLVPSTTQTAAGSSSGLQIDMDSVPSG